MTFISSLSLIDFSANFLAYTGDVAAARGADLRGPSQHHEKATNASQPFEEGSGSSLLERQWPYSRYLFQQATLLQAPSIGDTNKQRITISIKETNFVVAHSQYAMPQHDVTVISFQSESQMRREREVFDGYMIVTSIDRVNP